MGDHLANRLGLTEPQVDIITGLLEQYVPHRPVWAFGSRAFGSARRRSDLDLAVGGDTRLPVGARMDLMDALDESLLPIEVDVVDLNDVDVSFRSRIEPDFVLIKEQGEGVL